MLSLQSGLIVPMSNWFMDMKDKEKGGYGLSTVRTAVFVIIVVVSMLIFAFIYPEMI